VNQEQICAAIKLYLEYDGPHHGVLIAADWGAGKTFLWREAIAPLAKKLKLKPVYVSANGIENALGFESALFAATYPILKNGVVGALSAVSRAVLNSTNIKIDLSELKASIGKAHVICVDDLERVDPKALSGILGTMALLVEVHECKLIVLADEAKLLSIDAYSIGKEKVFERTFEYQLEVGKIVDVSLSQYAREHGIARAVAEVLEASFQGVISKSNCRNLRVLQRAARRFFELYRIMDGATTLSMEASGYLCRVVASVEIFIQQNPRQKELLRRAFSPGFSVVSLYIGDETHGEKRILRDFFDQFFPEYVNSFTPMIATFEFIADGVIDLKGIREQLTPKDRSKESATARVLNGLHGLSDAEFRRVTTAAINRISSGKERSLQSLLQLSDPLFYYAKKGFINLSTRELRGQFETGLMQLAKQHDKVLTGIDLSFRIGSYLIDGEHQAVEDVIKKLDHDINAKQLEKKRDKIISAIAVDNKSFCDAMYGTQSIWSRQSMFETTHVDAVVNAIERFLSGRRGDNRKLEDLAKAFRIRYKDASATSSLRGDREFLVELRERIQDLLAHKSGASQFSIGILGQLSDLLEQASANLET